MPNPIVITIDVNECHDDDDQFLRIFANAITTTLRHQSHEVTLVIMNAHRTRAFMPLLVVNAMLNHDDMPIGYAAFNPVTGQKSEMQTKLPPNVKTIISIC